MDEPTNEPVNEPADPVDDLAAIEAAFRLDSRAIRCTTCWNMRDYCTCRKVRTRPVDPTFTVTNSATSVPGIYDAIARLSNRILEDLNRDLSDQLDRTFWKRETPQSDSGRPLSPPKAHKPKADPALDRIVAYERKRLAQRNKDVPPEFREWFP